MFQGHPGEFLIPRETFFLQGHMGTLCSAPSLSIPTPPKGVSCLAGWGPSGLVEVSVGLHAPQASPQK